MDEPKNTSRRGRTLAIAGGVLAGVAIAAAVWLFRSGNAGRILMDVVNHQLAGASNMRVHWRELQGNALERVTVEGLQVELKDAGGWHPFLEAREVTVDAGVPQLLKAARLTVRSLNPLLTLSYDSSGTVLLPKLSSGSKSGRPSLQEVWLQLNGGRVRILRGGRAREFATDLNAGGRLDLGGDPRIEIRRMSVRLPQWQVDVRQLSAQLRLDSRGWHWQDLVTHGAGFALHSDGRYASEQDFQLDADADSLSNRALSGWLPASLPAGTYSGKVQVRGEGKRLTFALKGRLRGERLGELAVEATGYNAAREFRVAPLEITSRGATARGSLDVLNGNRAALRWSLQGFDPAAQVFLPATLRVPRTRLAGTGTTDVSWTAHGLREIGGTAALAASSLEGFTLDTATTAYRFRRDTLELTDLRVRSGASRASGHVTIGPKDAVAGGGQVDGDLATLDILVRKAGPGAHGRFRGPWRLSGTGARPVVSADLSLQALRWGQTRVDSGSAAVEWRGPGIEGLTARASLNEIGVADVRIRHLSLETLGGPKMKVLLAASAGDSTFSTRALVDWRDSSAVADSGQLDLGGKHWAQTGETAIRWGAAGLSWNNLSWRSPDGDSVSTSGRYVPQARALEATLSARNWALGPLTAHFLGRSAPDGLLSGEARISGTIANPSAMLSLSVDRAVVGKHNLDHIDIVGTLRGGVVELSRLEVRKGDSEIHGTGRLDLPQVRMRGLNAFADTAGHGFRGASLDGALDVTSLDLAVLGEFSEPLTYASGTAHGSIRLGGSPLAPQIHLSMNGDSLTFRDVDLGKVKLAASYQGEMLTLDTLEVHSQAATSSLTGQLPLRLTTSPFSLTLPEKPMHLSVEVAHGEAQLLAVFVPSVFAYASGQFSLKGRIEGTPGKPLFRGDGVLDGATLRPAGRDEVLRDVHAEVAIEDHRLQLKALQASIGRRGTLSGSGWMELAGQKVENYHFDVKAVDAGITDQENYSAVAGGTLTIDPRSQSDRNPLIKGELKISEGLLLPEFGVVPPTLQSTNEKPLIRWYYDLSITAPSAVWWRNSQANIEVGGDIRVLNLGGTDEGQGSFEIRRGNFDVYDTSFRIQTGTVTFNGPVADPALTLTADAKVGALAVSLAIQDTRVSKLNYGSLQFSSGSHSQSELINYMTVGRFFGGLGDNPDSTSGNRNLTAPFGNLLLNNLRRALGRDVSGIVDVVDLNSAQDASGVDVTTVGVGKYVTPDVFVKYAQGLNASTDRELSVEWRLNKVLLLTGETRHRLPTSPGTTAVESESNIDLKARWEF